MKFVIYIDVDGAYRWQLYPIGNGPPVACSVRGYQTKAECIATIQRVREAAQADLEDRTNTARSSVPANSGAT